VRLEYRIAAVTALIGLSCAAPARAEGTISVAFDSASAPRPTVGFGFGRAPRPVGFEVEFATTAGHASSTQTAVGTAAVSVLVNTPLRIGATSVYALAGFGVYGETGGGSSSGAAGALHVGAGAAVPLKGPVKLRLEYRFIALREHEGPVVSTHPQRVSAGISVGF